MLCQHNFLHICHETLKVIYKSLAVKHYIRAEQIRCVVALTKCHNAVTDAFFVTHQILVSVFLEVSVASAMLLIDGPLVFVELVFPCHKQSTD